MNKRIIAKVCHFVVIFYCVSHKSLAVQRLNKSIHSFMYYFKHKMAFNLIPHFAFFIIQNSLIIDFKPKGRFLFCSVFFRRLLNRRFWVLLLIKHDSELISVKFVVTSTLTLIINLCFLFGSFWPSAMRLIFWLIQYNMKIITCIKHYSRRINTKLKSQHVNWWRDFKITKQWFVIFKNIVNFFILYFVKIKQYSFQHLKVLYHR